MWDRIIDILVFIYIDIIKQFHYWFIWLNFFVNPNILEFTQLSELFVWHSVGAEAVDKVLQFAHIALVFLLVIIGIVDSFHKHLAVVDAVGQCTIE